MIVRICAIEWRGKIDDPKWRRTADAAIAVGSWLPAVLWGVAFAALVRGLPVNADKQMQLVVHRHPQPVHVARRAGHRGLFAFHGAVFVRLKTEGQMRDDATRFASLLAIPVTVVVAAFGVWTQLAHGKDWTWLILGVAVVAQLGGGHAGAGADGGDGWAFASTAVVVASVVALLFACLYPNLIPSTLEPRLEPDDPQRVVDARTP